MTQLTVLNASREEAVRVLNEAGIKVQSLEFKVELYHDYDYPSISEELLVYPTITEGYNRWRNDVVDNSNGDILHYLEDYLSDEELYENVAELLKYIVDIPYNIREEAWTADDWRDEWDEYKERFRDMLYQNLDGSINKMAEFCSEFGINHYYGVSKGYSQGDARKVLIVPMLEDEIPQETLENQFKEIGYWLWGDCYGFTITDQYDIVYESCWGFLHNDRTFLGDMMVENIIPETYGMTRESFIKAIEEAKVKY